MCDPLEMVAGLEGRQQQVLSSRALDETNKIEFGGMEQEGKI